MVEVVKIGKAAPVPIVIEAAEEILARAKSGELRSLIWIADGGDGWLHGFTAQDDMMQAVGQLARLMHRLQVHLDDKAMPG